MSGLQTWTSIDKSSWAAGPWMDEPDKAHWKDTDTGLDCLIVRGPHGALCGYVGVSAGHPWHGLDYDACGKYLPKPEDYDPDWYPDVHGGLTYAAGCRHSDDPSCGICHVPAPGEPDDTWWLGFDCAHAGDISPKMDRIDHPVIGMGCPTGWGTTYQYRDFDYVRAECAKLARAALASADPA